ncbi:uncharacterized protein TNCV_1118851 [Trichonephila clavipes]|uniref:Integrase catalytic domain-containing protein n=1 Tax=Trichonephila clavipes TaxID=2585209 RepID=A0A8X6SWG1_TRICX|nr:uncharacterized protein TNCV_1118851 [Trichonephila clavipes]
MIRWTLKLSEFNLEWEHRPGVQNAVAHVLSRNPVGNMDGSHISCAALRALALNSREQLIREQREDPELGHIYRYLENPDDGSVNATVCDAQAIANALFENYISRYGAPISLISDNGLQFISEVFEHLSHRVLKVRNNNLILWRKGKRVTVNINQVRLYHPLQSDTISSDSHLETLYEGQRSSNRSSGSQPGKFKGSRKTSSEESHGSKSNKGNAGWEDPRLKRKVESNGSGDRKDLKRSKICRKRSLQGSKHRDQKRPTPEPKQGIERAIQSSVPSRNYKYRRPNNLSQGSQSIAGPSHPSDSRQNRPPTEGSRHEGSGQYDKARETRTTKNGTNRAVERRPVWSKQATAVRHCPYYLRSRVRQPEGIPEERRNIGIESIPQNNIRRRSLSMEALDG